MTPSVSRFARALRCLWGACLLWCTASSVRAHGDPPAVLDLVAARDGDALLVALSEGHALRTHDAFQFLCPALVGAETPPLALAAGGPLWLVGPGEIYRLDTDASELPQPVDGPSAAHVVALAALDAQVYALTFTEQGSELWRLGDGEPRWSDTRSWVSLVQRGAGFALGRVEGAALRILELDARGGAGRERLLELGVDNPVVRLRVAGDGLYAMLIAPGEYRLLELGEDSVGERLRSPTPIQGPVQRAGELLVASGGAPMRLAASGAEALDETRFVRCLGSLDGLGFGCEQTRLYGLDDDRTLFALEGLLPPPGAHLAGPDGARCAAQWLLFRNDLASIDVAVPGIEAEPAQAPASDASVDEPGSAADGDGCSVRAGAPRTSYGSIWLAPLALWAARGSRRWLTAPRNPLR